MDKGEKAGKGNASGIVEQIKARLKEHPFSCYKHIDNLLELSYQVYLEINSAEKQELKEITEPLEKTLFALANSDKEADEYINVVYELCAVYERQSYMEGMKVGARLVIELLEV